MSGYLWPDAKRRMPAPVQAARVILLVVGGMCLLLFCGAVILTADAEEVGQIAGLPLILGAAGIVLAWQMKPNRLPIRVGVIVVEAAWLVVALGRLAQGDPTGVVAMVLPIVVLVLVNRASARRYFRSNKAR